MQLMHRLTEKDIKMLTTDRNVPEVLRLAARRVLTKAAQQVELVASIRFLLLPNSFRISARPSM